MIDQENDNSWVVGTGVDLFFRFEYFMNKESIEFIISFRR